MVSDQIPRRGQRYWSTSLIFDGCSKRIFQKSFFHTKLSWPSSGLIFAIACSSTGSCRRERCTHIHLISIDPLLRQKSAMAPQEKLNDEEPSDFNIQNPTRIKEPQALPILPIDVAFLRFLVLVVLSWVLFYASMSANAEWTVETYIPWSFWLLHYLLIFGIIGGGWPLVAPFGMDSFKGFWGGHGRVPLGAAMTGIAVGVAVALSTFFTNIWWGYPLFPGGAWFGIGLFWVTLWWVLDIQITPHPLIPHHRLPIVNIIVSSITCILIAVALFQFVDYDFPFADDSSNPEGPASASWWFGCAVSIIVWVSAKYFVQFTSSIFVSLQPTKLVLFDS